MVPLADEMQAVHLVRTLAVLQDREKILRIGCVGTEPIKRRDALVLCSDMSLALGKVLVRPRDRGVQPLSAGQIVHTV
jgi:hypothetical protein